MSDRSLAKQLEALKEELKKPLPPPLNSEGNEMAEKKKAVKKVVKKKEAVKTAGDVIHLSDLAKEAEVTPQRIRQKLREANVKRDGRWTWEKGSKDLKEVRKVLGLAA